MLRVGSIDPINDMKPFRFHDNKGNLYAMSYTEHWIGCCGENGRLKWSAGNNLVGHSDYPLFLDLQNPHYITDTPDDMLLISSSGNKKVYKVNPVDMAATVLIDGHDMGLTDVGNCVYDSEGNIWINEIQGCRIWLLLPMGLLYKH